MLDETVKNIGPLEGAKVNRELLRNMPDSVVANVSSGIPFDAAAKLIQENNNQTSSPGDRFRRTPDSSDQPITGHTILKDRLWKDNFLGNLDIALERYETRLERKFPGRQLEEWRQGQRQNLLDTFNDFREESRDREEN